MAGALHAGRYAAAAARFLRHALALKLRRLQVGSVVRRSARAQLRRLQARRGDGGECGHAGIFVVARRLGKGARPTIAPLYLADGRPPGALPVARPGNY